MTVACGMARPQRFGLQPLHPDVIVV